MTNFFKSFQ